MEEMCFLIFALITFANLYLIRTKPKPFTPTPNPKTQQKINQK